jgi:small-conductance mechanosensitive channel
MRTRKILTGVFITALVVAIAFIAMRSYYVGVAVIAWMILIGYREIWSLITTRKLPPLDERIRENTNKSVRNGFVFLMLVLGYLMMPFSVRLVDGGNISIVLGGLLMSGGLVYCLSYIFYDRVEPKLSSRRSKILKGFLFTIAISIALYILGGLLHNVVFAIFDIEEPVFFTVALLGIAGVAVGIIGCLVMFVHGLVTKPAV